MQPLQVLLDLKSSSHSVEAVKFLVIRITYRNPFTKSCEGDTGADMILSGNVRRNDRQT